MANNVKRKQSEPEPAPEREPTATEQLEALAARAHTCNGLLLPVPELVTRLTVLQWLQQIAEIGAPGHLDIAWSALNAPKLKQSLLDNGALVSIYADARRRHGELERRAKAEFDAEHAAWLERTKKADRAREKARLEAELAALK